MASDKYSDRCWFQSGPGSQTEWAQSFNDMLPKVNVTKKNA